MNLKDEIKNITEDFYRGSTNLKKQEQESSAIDNLQQTIDIIIRQLAEKQAEIEIKKIKSKIEKAKEKGLDKKVEILEEEISYINDMLYNVKDILISLDYYLRLKYDYYLRLKYKEKILEINND